MIDRRTYDVYTDILRHELVPALGCTEPIAIAFASAKAREVLGEKPLKATAYLSGNIIKNVKSVIVPNSNGERGIEIAVALGCVGGVSSLQYEVLEKITDGDIARAKELVAAGFVTTRYVAGKDNLYIRILLEGASSTADVTVEHEHTRVTRIEKDGEVLLDKPVAAVDAEDDGKSLLNVRDICTYTAEVDLEDVRDVLERAIRLNSAISAEGLSGNYGESVGKQLMEIEGDRVEGRAAARAAAGSDARMNGCSMPVVINSGSGNQGMTITLPICEYAATWNKDQETLMRALVMANLISVHIKRHIGNLSAFCGAVSAGCGAACGIAWMDGCDYDQICMIITNTLCTLGGMVCDGAKSSCAAKIASAVNAGTLSYRMAKNRKVFQDGEGLVGADIEQTIENVGRMGRDGMHATDVEILNIMIGN